MTNEVREVFSSEATRAVLDAIRELAKTQGREFHAVLDDAMREYVDRHQNGSPRPQVAASFAASLNEFDSLYRELAK